MKLTCRAVVAVLVALATLAGSAALARQGDFLSDEEADALRDAQDPGKRIEVYLDLEQSRLEHMQGLRDYPLEMSKVLSHFISLNEEMKDWIQYQYNHRGDMRKGLRALLERGPQQLEQLRQIQHWPGAAQAQYASSVQDAMDSVTDGLNGATQAFADQQKLFGELKIEKKETERALHERLKEEKKRNKEEKKLRKRMEHESKPDSSEN
jgi:hypothetical protein